MLGQWGKWVGWFLAAAILIAAAMVAVALVLFAWTFLERAWAAA